MLNYAHMWKLCRLTAKMHLIRAMSLPRALQIEFIYYPQGICWLELKSNSLPVKLIVEFKLKFLTKFE